MKRYLLFFLFTNLLFNSIYAQNATLREGITIPTLEINLYAQALNGTMFLADGVLQNFNNNYSAAVDNHDVRKFMNITDNLAIKNGSYNLIVERRPNITVADTSRLLLTGTRIGLYKFEIDPSVLNYPNIKGYLLDKFLLSETSFSLQSVTSISFDITADPLSRVADRFLIVYRLQPQLIFTELAAKRNIDNTINICFKTANENNVNFYTIERSVDSLQFEPLATQMPTSNNYGNPYYNYTDATSSSNYNWYRIKENGIDGRITFSMVAKAAKSFTQIKGTINVFPNPITNKVINVFYENLAFGNYVTMLFNNAGQLIYTQMNTVQTAYFKKAVFLPNLKTGIYRMIIIDDKKQQKSLSLVLK